MSSSDPEHGVAYRWYPGEAQQILAGEPLGFHSHAIADVHIQVEGHESAVIQARLDGSRLFWS